MRRELLVGAAVLAIVLAGCSGGASAATPAATATAASEPAIASAAAAPAGTATPSATSPAASADTAEIQVYAAASLKKAMGEVAKAWTGTHPGQSIVLSTDSSTALATKIEQGAPADLFLSADAKNPQSLVDRGVAVGPPTTFATSRLVVIVPRDNPAGITSPADLARPGVKVIAAGDTVPITKYATQLVGILAGLPGYPAGFEAAYAANVASKEDNVAGIVTKIALGEGDAGIVYATDAAGNADVAGVEVPADANVVATYDGVVIKDAPQATTASELLAWLAGPDGRRLLAGFGFLPAP